MTNIYLTNLETSNTAATAASFPSSVAGADSVTFATAVEVSITLANAKELFKFTSAGDDVTAETVTGEMTNKSTATVTGKPDANSAVTLDYVKDLATLVFGTDLLIDALDNEAAIATDYVAKYDDCITQVLRGGGDVTDPVTDRTGTNGADAAVAAVAGLLNNTTSRQRFELQYNFAPLETFTNKGNCAVYLKADGADPSVFTQTALANFGLNVDMTNASTINTIVRGTISDNHSLATGDTLLIQNQFTGETITTELTDDTAGLLNNTSGTLTDIFDKANFGYSAVTGGAISVQSGTAGTGGAAAGTLDIAVDARGAVTSITVNGTNTGYGTDSILQVTSGTKTITFTVGTNAVLAELRGGTNNGDNLLDITDAAFTNASAVTFNGSNGTGAELSLTAVSGIPTALAISTAGSGYTNSGATVSVTIDSKPVVITLDNQEVNAQLNGLSLSSSIVASGTAVTAVKGPGFTAGTGLPVTEVTGEAAGNGASALVTVQMAGTDVSSVQKEGTAGADYDEANRLIVTNFADGTVISTGTNTANSVQVGILNNDMTTVNVPFEGSDTILTEVSITTPSGQTNTAGETPAATTQTSLLKISFT